MTGSISIITDVYDCARCNSDHMSMRFVKMEQPFDPDYSYWALCPNGKGPILMVSLKVTVGSD